MSIAAQVTCCFECGCRVDWDEVCCPNCGKIMQDGPVAVSRELFSITLVMAGLGALAGLFAIFLLIQ
jgi:hypothetical protein